MCQACRRCAPPPLLFRHHDATQRHSPMLHDDVDRRIHLDGVVPKQRVVVDREEHVPAQLCGDGLADHLVAFAAHHDQGADHLLDVVHLLRLVDRFLLGPEAPDGSAQGDRAVANRDDDTANIMVEQPVFDLRFDLLVGEGDVLLRRFRHDG